MLCNPLMLYEIDALMICFKDAYGTRQKTGRVLPLPIVSNKLRSLCWIKLSEIRSEYFVKLATLCEDSAEH